MKSLKDTIFNKIKINVSHFYPFLIRTLRFPIYYFKEFLRYQINQRIEIPNGPVVKKLRNGLYCAIDFMFDRRVHRIYRELYEPHIVRAIKKYLKKGETFIDVGASIGYLTIIGAGCVGKKGNVHSFEPVPIYFSLLKKSAKLNRDYRIFPNESAIGNSSGTASIKITTFPLFNTMVKELVEEEILKEILEVKVQRLDDYIYKNRIDRISLIKIDIEGNEYTALQGLTKYFEKETDLPVIICEIVPLSADVLINLEKLMANYNYRAFDILTEKPIDIKKINRTTDVLFKNTPR